MTYAENTSVPVEKSKAEIERILSRYGADQFMQGWGDGSAIIAFRANGRHVKFILPLPDRSDPFITHVKRARSYYPSLRTENQQEAAYDQQLRQRWRALALVVKAKLEAVEAGITTFDDEFLAHLLLPDGDTVGQWMQPQLEQVYATGIMPQRLLGLPAARS